MSEGQRKYVYTKWRFISYLSSHTVERSSGLAEGRNGSWDRLLLLLMIIPGITYERIRKKLLSYRIYFHLYAGYISIVLYVILSTVKPG